MSKQVKIEPAKTEDGEQVMSLVCDSLDVFSPVNIPTEANTIARAFINFSSDGDKCLFVAKDGEDVIGMLGGYLEGTITDSATKFGWESLFFILPEHRGNGVAKGLLEAFEKWCADKGAKAIVMGCMKKVRGDKLGKFYSRHGYEPYDMSFIKEVG